MVTPSERSRSDLLMQSAGLLIICHMRRETTREPTKSEPGRSAPGRFIGRSHRTPSIVRTGKVPVKPQWAVGSPDQDRWQEAIKTARRRTGLPPAALAVFLSSTAHCRLPTLKRSKRLLNEF